MSIEAMKQAQALRELADRFSEGWHDGIKIDASDIMLLAMAASTIEQAEKQEPVGKVNELFDEAVIEQCGFDRELLVYTTPFAAQRQWVSLTDEEIFETHKQVDSMQYLTFGKAIEAKLREKNGGAM